MLPKPVVDYRRFRLKQINTPEFSHLKLLIFWPVYVLLFGAIERDVFGDTYTPVEIFLDEWIPFCEWFVIPYTFWFFFLLGIHIYTLFYDIASFRRLMTFLFIAYFGTLTIYLICPTCQNLRPTTFERDNLLVRYMRFYYTCDTNTNVCPSLHVAGSWAVVCGAWKSRHFSSRKWRIAFVITALLISVSTCFVKQHSALDVILAIPLCVLGWRVAMRLGSSSSSTPTQPKRKWRRRLSV
ncbi:MAG: phosphatase PAP2 family protein [Oscillospiraceae bacterium]|nr:phosphatase PAP2 family protein [Oscillospiraceae bacterium]